MGLCRGKAGEAGYCGTENSCDGCYQHFALDISSAPATYETIQHVPHLAIRTRSLCWCRSPPSSVARRVAVSEETAQRRPIVPPNVSKGRFRAQIQRLLLTTPQ